MLESSVRKLVLFLFILSTGCASTYIGTGPNMQATGEDAVEEFHKFKIKGLGRPSFSVVMGEENKDYTVQSITPFVKNVSEEGYGQFRTAEKWRLAQTTTLWLSVASLIAYVANTDNKAFGYAAEGLALSSIALSFSWGGNLKDGIEVYNNSLEEKLRAGFRASEGR